MSLSVQIFSGRCAHQSVQEQRGKGGPIPESSAHGGLLDPVGGRRLGHERRPREDRLEQGPFLCLLQGLRHRGLLRPRILELPLEPWQLVGGPRLQGAQPSPGQAVPLGPNQPHDLRLLPGPLEVPHSTA